MNVLTGVEEPPSRGDLILSSLCINRVRFVSARNESSTLRQFLVGLRICLINDLQLSKEAEGFFG